MILKVHILVHFRSPMVSNTCRWTAFHLQSLKQTVLEPIGSILLSRFLLVASWGQRRDAKCSKASHPMEPNFKFTRSWTFEWCVGCYFGRNRPGFCIDTLSMTFSLEKLIKALSLLIRKFSMKVASNPSYCMVIGLLLLMGLSRRMNASVVYSTHRLLWAT